jgi:hypothetical protein
VQDAAAAASDTESSANAVYESALAAEVPATVIPVMADTPVEEAAAADSKVAVTDSTSDLRRGDIVLDSDDAFVEPAGNIVIPDTELAGPETLSTSPNVPTAIITTDSRNESTSMLTWLIGGGFAIVAGLILFGRRARATLWMGSITTFPTTLRPRKISRSMPISLLEQGSWKALEWSWPRTLVLLRRPNSTSNCHSSPRPKELESILESEVLPEDDDYDMSVIMDATKMPRPEDVTERDLMAVPVGTDDGTLISDNYTISKEVDFDILEQDYEDAQALNDEIARAAAELVEDLEQDADNEEFSELSLAPVTGPDLTAQLPQHDDQTAEMKRPVDSDNTGQYATRLNYSIPASRSTFRQPLGSRLPRSARSP